MENVGQDQMDRTPTIDLVLPRNALMVISNIFVMMELVCDGWDVNGPITSTELQLRVGILFFYS